MNQEYPTAFEPNNQILAAPLNGVDDLALELCGDLPGLDGARHARIEDLDSLEPASDEHRLEVSANRLDLGELGHAVGNALEIREAVATLRGDGPGDLRELAIASAAHLLALSDGVASAEGRSRAERALDDGSALETYDRWIHAQGGDPAETSLPSAPVVREVGADAGGIVTRLRALAVGIASVHLGAGRAVKDAPIDHAVGIVCRAKRGDQVSAGDVLAEIHARDETSAVTAATEVQAAYELADGPAERGEVILETLA